MEGVRMKDSFGDRMKFYESSTYDSSKLLPKIPILARLDGVAFHTFTRGYKRPYDETLSFSMKETMKHLCEESNALVGYTQSDEISLMWLVDGFQNQMWFDGKVQKLTSVLASVATYWFNIVLDSFKPAYFDCRVWNVPTKMEAINAFLWRQKDATKNSISMAAQHHFSHKELQGKNSNEKQEMLWTIGVNWNNYPAHFKRGTFCFKKIRERKFTVDELSKLPEKHEAHTNPNLLVKRSSYEYVELPPITQIANISDVFFNGADYILEKKISI